MKKLMSILLTIAMVCTFAIVPVSAETTTDAWDGTVATGFAGGDGSEANPYKIANAAQLAYLAKSMWDAYKVGAESPVLSAAESSTEEKPVYNAYTGKYFELANDMDLKKTEWSPIGNYHVRFNGNFNGNGHVISNMKITKQWTGMGLFGATGYAVNIKKLGLENVEITYAGATSNTTEDETLAGKNAADRTLGAAAFIGIIGGGTVENCYAKNVSYSQTGAKMQSEGGFIGVGYSAEKHSGMVNQYNKTYVTNCYVKDVKIIGNNDTYRGAFCGNVYPADNVTDEERCEVAFKNCYAGGNIEMTNGSGTHAFARCGARTSTYKSGLTPATKLYTSVSTIDGATDKSINSTYAADAAAMSTALVDNDNYYPDTKNENGGWPVLAWETGIEMWDGTVAAGFDSGTGTKDDPYVIATAEQLAYLAKSMWDAYKVGAESPVLSAAESSTEEKPVYNAYTGKYFELANDMDLKKTEWSPIGNYHVRFNGNFNGNGHVISNMKITTQWTGMGLFGATGYAVNIKKLGLENVEITYAGAISNTTEDETLAGKYASDRTLGAAAFIGIIGGGTVENCYAKNVSYSQTGAKMQCEGGFIGSGVSAEMRSGTTNPYNKTYVTNCYIKDVTVTGHNDTYRGAFIGNAGINESSTAEASDCDIAFKNCYVGGTSTVSKGNRDNSFGQKNFAYGSGLTPVTNCYTVISDATNWRNMGGTYVEDVEALSTALVDNTNYFADTKTENGGWPVLLWETDLKIWEGDVAKSFAGGTGTKEDPYQISSPEELAYLAKSMWDAYAKGTASGILATAGLHTESAPKYNAYTDKYFELIDDIDLCNIEWTPIGTYAVRFDGIFNGNGHVIKNLKMTKDYLGIGLFGATGKNSVIKNVGLENANVTFTGTNGNVACEDYKSQQVYYNDRIFGAGSFIGLMGGGTVENCYAKTVTVKQTGAQGIHGGLGGFIGSGEAIEDYTAENTAGVAANVKYCYAKDVTVTSTPSFVGAFVGNNAKGSATANGTAMKFTNCYVGGTASVSGTAIYAWGAANNGVLTKENIYTVVKAEDEKNTSWRMYTPTEYASTAKSATIGLTDNENFYADHPNIPINGGWPILAWEKTWEIVNPFADWTFAKLSNERQDSVTKDLTLTTKVEAEDGDHNITYTSTNTDVLSNDGKITEPLYDTKITFTAYDEATGVTKAFDITVLGALTKAFNEGLNGQARNRIKSDITLPAWVENNGSSFHVSKWESNNKAALSDSGEVGVVLIDTVVRLTANIDGKKTSFDVTVLSKTTEDYIDESFDSVAFGTTVGDITGFAEKTGSNGTKENTVDMTVEVDPTNPANKVLKMRRFVMWDGSKWYMGDGSEIDTSVYNDGTVDSEYVQYTLPEAKTSGKYELSFRIMFGSGTTQVMKVLIPGLASTQNTWFMYGSSQLLNQIQSAGDGDLRKYTQFETKTGMWYDYSMVIDLDSNSYRARLTGDGKSYSQYGTLGSQASKSLSSFSLISERKADISTNGDSIYYFDDFKVSKIELSDADIVTYDAAQLYIPSVAANDISLVTEGAEGSAIEWTSSDDKIIEITNDGALADVKYATIDKVATLTATVTNGETTVTKTFDVKVPAKNYYEIKGFVMADDAEFGAGATITGIQYKNNISKTAVAYVAVFNGERFVDAATATLNEGKISDSLQTVPLSKSITLPDDLTGYEVKAFIWDPATLSPVAEMYTSDRPSTTLWMLGDSIMTEYAVPAQYPMTGWGQLFGEYLTDNVTIENRAHGGYTTLSYFTESMVDDLTEWEDQVKEGDYAIIGLGINDSNPVRGVRDITHYEELLRDLIARLQAKGAEVILSTPTITFGTAGDSVGQGYTAQAAVNENVAGELGLAVIDLNDVMYQRLCNIHASKVAGGMTGEEAVEYIRDTYYCWDLEANGWDLAGSSQGATLRDGTHLNVNGSHMVAAMAAELLKASESTLGGYVNVTTSLWDGSKSPTSSN